MWSADHSLRNAAIKERDRGGKLERKRNKESKQDREYTYEYNVTKRHFLATIVGGENNKYYVVCMCVCVALAIQHVQRMRRIVMCGLSGCTYFSTLSHKRKISHKNNGT